MNAKPVTPPIEQDTLAEAITKISAGVTALRRSGLNKRAIVVLLQDLTGVNKREIIQVIDGLSNLAANYTAKKL